MYSAYHRTRRYTATHAKPRPPWVTRALLALGALLVVIALGFGGYAAGTAVTSPQAPITHSKVVIQSRPQPAPHAVPVPVPTAHALHAAHLWHVLHVQHVAHLAWLASHGVQTE